MKNRSLVAAGRTLNVVAAAALVLLSSGAHALGLGRVNVQSVLGEPLRAETEVTSLNADEASSLKVNLATPEAFRAAGVDYNAALAGAQISLARRPDGKPVLILSSDRTVQEPFVDVIVDFSWSTGRLQRSYTLLIDPPGRNVAAQPGTTPVPPVFSAPPPAPRVAAAPSPAPVPSVLTPVPPVAAPAPAVRTPAPPAPAPAPAPIAAAPRPAPTPAPKPPAPAPEPAPAPAARAPRAAPAPAPTAASGETYKVKPGDTLTSIAGTTVKPGVTLEQMLVGLYRNNPQAFMDDNMNRMRSGVVLGVPSAEQARQATPQEAHSVIQAQSADFQAYRQRLAGGAPVVRTDEGKRQSSGKIEAQVHDQKTANAPATPDKLTLSRGQVKNPANTVEAKVSKEAERKAAADRVAELSRNVAELKNLGPGKAAPAPAPTPAAKTPAVPLPAITVAKAPPPAPVPAPVPAAKPPVPAPTPVVAPKPAPAPAPVVLPAPVPAPVVAKPASAALPSVAAVVPAASSAASSAAAMAHAGSAAVTASGPVVAAARPSAPASRPAVPAAAAASEPEGFLSSLIDNPFAMLGAGLVVALGALAVFWRSRQRAGKFGSGETSFMESKIQPDSFFGASGGQRVDTRDGAQSSSSSSLNYSLSQLDAIGDVDPVAEADVYLAYGRDLQAEEILKEAQRSDPDRLAIRTKLLEVYAKRADLKTFEAQARQLHGLTGGVGEDWAKAQELGRQIDPTNPLYQEGQDEVAGDSQVPTHLATMPPSQFAENALGGATAELPGEVDDHGALDLDIDLDSTPAADADATLLSPAPAPMSHALDMDLPPLDEVESIEPAGMVEEEPVELGDFQLDEPTHAAPATPAAAPAPAAQAPVDFDFGDLTLDLDTPPAAAGAGAAAAAPAEPVAEPDTLDMPDLDLPSAAHDGDPMARKIELADEFRRIGDHEGARELLEEVVAKVDGPLRARAQAMLDELG